MLCLFNKLWIRDFKNNLYFCAVFTSQLKEGLTTGDKMDEFQYL